MKESKAKVTVELGRDALDLLSFRYYRNGIISDEDLVKAAVNEVAYYQFSAEMDYGSDIVSG